MKKKKVIVALSGGVDSSVSAFLLKQKGYDVIGVFMKIWHNENTSKTENCPWVEDSSYALEVADQLNIPFHVIDLSKEYKDKIVDYMYQEYSYGSTPNQMFYVTKKLNLMFFLIMH